MVIVFNSVLPRVSASTSLRQRGLTFWCCFLFYLEKRFEKWYVVSKVLILTKKEPRRMMYLMRHACTIIQNFDEQMILLFIQVSWVGMLGTNLDYLARIGPPSITIEVFLSNKSNGPRSSKIHGKRKTTTWWRGRSSM